ncbi:MAG: GDPmannose 4,6-dehydratase, partial [Thermoleophilaceae bacterium]|nr:GDPmannose 4,6-dehydratase [Thermoleophilaceae bacterium]
MAKRALITGIGGQDGSYLAELLLDKGYEVHGMVRQGSSTSLDRIAHIAREISIHAADLHDKESLHRTIRASRPDEVYNLAGTSFVSASWSDPVTTADLTATGAIRLLEALREGAPDARFYQASSSEIFGVPVETPQVETTPITPRTPYGVAKSYAHLITVTYRETYDLFACAGILYNHESPRRGPEFVTRKITRAAAAIKEGLEDGLALGALDACRDWGYAEDYVEAMWLMLQQDHPEDYVIATGVQHSVREFVEAAFGHIGLDPWGYVEHDPALMRPSEPVHLVGDYRKAREKLGWEPRTSFEQLVRLMVDHDLELLAGRMQQKQSG